MAETLIAERDQPMRKQGKTEGDDIHEEGPTDFERQERIERAARRLGLSYLRFSAPKQAEGDSEERQERDFRRFCQRHNLCPLREVYADRGKSGYTGAHRKKGRLGELIEAVKSGRIEKGTVIVVEAWDRLGRMRPDKQVKLVAELLELGVDIGICRLDDIFTEVDFGTHKWTTLAVFIQLAYQESKQKAERVAGAWERKRERAREEGELLTRRIPGWLREVNGKLLPVPERVTALKRIFALAADGYGEGRTVGQLTAEEVPPLGTEKWTRPYVSKILRDRRVLGELQPCTTDGKPDGEVLKGYYPQVISDAEYNLARAAMTARKQCGEGNKGMPRDSRYVNVFQGLLVHARDGEGFFLHNRGGKASAALRLVSAGGDGGRATTATFPYLPFETAILGKLAEVDPVSVLPPEKEKAARADELRARLKVLRADIEGLQADLNTEGGYSKRLAAILREKEQAEERLAAGLQEELARSARPAERALGELPGLVEMIEKSAEPDAVRLKIRSELRRVLESISVLTVRRGSFLICCAQVFFTGGACRDYFILYQSPGFHRPGGLIGDPISDRVDTSDLDLRQPGHVARLEKALMGLDLSDLADEQSTR
jgi:DNA invertase Pin-like site-specific DNA recombinase